VAFNRWAGGRYQNVCIVSVTDNFEIQPFGERKFNEAVILGTIFRKSVCEWNLNGTALVKRVRV